MEQLLTLDTAMQHKCDDNIYFNAVRHNIFAVSGKLVLYFTHNNPQTQLV